MSYELLVDGRIEIHNVLGETIYSSPLITHNSSLITKLNVSFLDKGIYFIRIESSRGNWNSRFIKE